MEFNDYTKSLIWLIQEKEVKKKELALKVAKKNNMPKVNAYSRYYLYGTDHSSYNRTLDDIGPCTVLEMLIALAEQIDTYGVSGMTDQERRSRFFWEMVANLGIVYSDFVYTNEIATECDHKIDIFLDRKYAENGAGSLFPIQNCSTDMRKIEIWYQMQTYFLEKNGI